MPRTVLPALVAALLAAAPAHPQDAPPVPAPAPTPAPAKARVFHWSGYRWVVRSSVAPEMPGNNLWGDTRQNARVQRDGSLRLNIYAGRSVELTGPPTGYGRYRWVVRSDLSAIDPFRVAAFFVRGTRGEQDIEFSRWANPLITKVGSWVTWRADVRSRFGEFVVTRSRSYTITIDRGRRTTRFLMQDARRRTLLDRRARSSGDGARVAPHVSYWLYAGNALVTSPYTVATVHPPIVLTSFKYRRAR